MTPDLESIAAGLSEAQRHAVLSMRGFDEPGDIIKALAMAMGVQFSPSHRPAGATIDALYRKGLVKRSRYGGYLTGLGLQLRTYLESRTRGEGEL